MKLVKVFAKIVVGIVIGFAVIDVLILAIALSL